MPELPPERVVGAGVSCATPMHDRNYTIMSRMKAYGGPNRPIMRYAQMNRADWEARVWESFHGSDDFIFRAPLVQLFDPHAARGYALLKPLGTNRRDRTKDSWAQPFHQWLRFRGYFQASDGWFADSDLRLYTPAPLTFRTSG